MGGQSREKGQSGGHKWGPGSTIHALKLFGMS